MKLKPMISVVICAYNAAHCIQGIFNSLKLQTFKNFEIIVVNDGSIDETETIAGANDARVINTQHQGLSAARNTGINHSSADIVAIIDADCYARYNWLEEINSEMKKGEIIVTGNTKIPKSTFLGECISGLGYPGGAHLGFEKMWPVDKNGYTIHLAGGNCAFKKRIIQKLGAFNESLTITADDVYLSMKILGSGLKIKYNPRMIMYHLPRKNLKAFLQWHYARGKGSYLFKQKVGSFQQFYKLRLWSTLNMIQKYKKDPKLSVIIFLLILSFVTQKIGYFMQMKEQHK